MGGSDRGTSLAFETPAAAPAGALRGFSVLYICIPAYNEAQTVGVLLWRIRKVFQEYSREYEILVFDDGSTDATAETLKPYTDVLPLTILGGTQRVGYARALDALCRAVSSRTKYARRDAMITLSMPEEGLGRAFGESLPKWAGPVAAAQALLLAALAGWPAGLWLAVANFAVVFLLRRWFVARLGGVTGDCLGMACQLSEAVSLGVLAWV